MFFFLNAWYPHRRVARIWKRVRRNPKFKRFFRPKSSDLQKKKKKKKKRSSPKFTAIFLPKFCNFKRFRGGSFRMGGAIFNFSQKIGLKSTKNMRFCMLQPPPWLRYCIHSWFSSKAPSIQWVFFAFAYQVVHKQYKELKKFICDTRELATYPIVTFINYAWSMMRKWFISV